MTVVSDRTVRDDQSVMEDGGVSGCRVLRRAMGAVCVSDVAVAMM